MALVRWTPRGVDLRKWEPLREMEAMTEEMDRLFEQITERMGVSGWRRKPILAERMWTPSIDMIDKKEEIIVKAELPGMEKKDIHVSVTGDVLVIRGERKTEQEVKDENYLRCETSYGSFMRTIPLPVSVESDKIKAEYKNGLLELHLPKTREVKEKAKEIAIE